MAKNIICKASLTGSLYSTIYITENGYTLDQLQCSNSSLGADIANICATQEIDKIALYGPATFLLKIKQDILENKTKFAYQNTEVLINPFNLEV